MSKTRRAEKFGDRRVDAHLGALKNALSQKVQKRYSRQWIVFFADYGGQILASVPSDLFSEAPDQTTTHRLLLKMNALTWPDEELGCFTQTVRNFHPYAQPHRLRYGLIGWRAVGSVAGGMGGGVLLDDDMWFCWELVARGIELMDRMRADLGLEPLTDAELIPF